jgi:hypothetical protein
MKQTHCRSYFASNLTSKMNRIKMALRHRSFVYAASLGTVVGVLLPTDFAAPVRAEETFASPDSLNVPRVGLETTVPVASRAAVPVSVLPDARPNGLAKYAPTFDVESILARHDLRAGRETCQLGIVPSPVPIGIRLGAALSPRLKFDGGIDVTIPGLSFAHNLSTRVDFDAIVDANFGGFSTLFPLTFDQIYRLALPVGSSLYFGGGIGPYFGERTRFGGKLLIGGTITSHFGLEGAIHFQGYGDPIATVQARFPF